MDNETATALMDFRESHGGTLSGMTRYTDHLDDMPAIGCEQTQFAVEVVVELELCLTQFDLLLCRCTLQPLSRSNRAVLVAAAW